MERYPIENIALKPLLVLVLVRVLSKQIHVVECE